MLVIVNKNKYIVLCKESFVSKKDGKTYYKLELRNRATNKSSDCFVNKLQYDTYEEMKEYELDLMYNFDGKYNVTILKPQ